MPFPISIEGTAVVPREDLPGATFELVSERIEEMLHAASASTVIRSDRRIEFTAQLARPVSNWNILVGTQSGEIVVDGTTNEYHVKYKLKTIVLSIVVTVMCIGMAFIIWCNSRIAPRGVGSIVTFVPVMWLWLVGGNYLIASIRFPSWLQSGLRKGKYGPG